METVIFSLVVLIFSVVLHEVSHALMADSLGDPTPRYAGRLSFNPIRHLDFFGSIILPIFLLVLTGGQGPIFGWAKPVPVNPTNFKDKKYGDLKVALSGPGANFLIALIFGLIMRFISLPEPLFYSFSIIVILNLLLAFFNLIPIPPLDGSHLLFSLLPGLSWQIKKTLEQYGFLILLLFFLFGFQFLFSLVFFVYKLIVGVQF
jgi:Zn-dependent protease